MRSWTDFCGRPRFARIGALTCAILLPLGALPFVANAAGDSGTQVDTQIETEAGARDLGTETQAIRSVWHPQEIRYSYAGLTTAYNCDAAESRIKNILLALGAHPNTKVRASGCFANRPSRHFFVTITTATPVTAKDAAGLSSGETPDSSKQELLKRMGVNAAIDKDEFQATWKTVDLARDRKLDLQPGDCELMQSLRDHVLPKLSKLSVRVITDRVNCVPNQLGIMTPELTVSALTALPGPDASVPDAPANAAQQGTR